MPSSARIKTFGLWSLYNNNNNNENNDFAITLCYVVCHVEIFVVCIAKHRTSICKK